ncbi:MAG: hypothetical protein R2856_23290 [Caldilineaceae bacterium]
MSSYRLQVTTLAPGSGRPSRRARVLHPASTTSPAPCCAAMAAALLRLGHTATSTLFQGLFESGKVHFGNLYPIKEMADDNTAFAATAWPVPVTAWSCKLHPGFRIPADASSAHGVVETLGDQLTGEAWGSTFDVCGQDGCSGRLEPFSGYYEPKHDGDYFVEPQVTKRLITRTALSDRSGRARDGSLFTVEAIEEDHVFVGFLHITDPNLEGLHDQLRNLLDQSRQCACAWAWGAAVGTAKSTCTSGTKRATATWGCTFLWKTVGATMRLTRNCTRQPIQPTQSRRLWHCRPIVLRL